MSEETTLTMSVPAAGKKYFGLSRNGAYDAAARGDLPTIRIGGFCGSEISSVTWRNFGSNRSCKSAERCGALQIAVPALPLAAHSLC